MNLISYLGRRVTVFIDRPLGSAHPRHPNMIYPVNYGFIPNTVSGDGAEIDCYILGIDQPIDRIEVCIIALIERYNDCEDKLVGAPEGIYYTREEIERAVSFQEQYFHTRIHMYSEGAIT